MGTYSPLLIAEFKAKDRDNAVYEYGLDFDTGKLFKISAIGGTEVGLSCSYRNTDKFYAALRSSPSRGKGTELYANSLDQQYEQNTRAMIGGHLESFEAGLAKYHEWSAKARELQPDPFRKEIPIAREFGQYWPQFAWTNSPPPQFKLRAKPGDPNQPFFEIIFRPQTPAYVADEGVVQRALSPAEVELLEGALQMREGPVEHLTKMAASVQQVMEEQKKSVQETFN